MQPGCNGPGTVKGPAIAVVKRYAYELESASDAMEAVGSNDASILRQARLTQVSHFGVLDASSCEESADAGQGYNGYNHRQLRDWSEHMGILQARSEQHDRQADFWSCGHRLVLTTDMVLERVRKHDSLPRHLDGPTSEQSRVFSITHHVIAATGFQTSIHPTR
ncbi:hypothetical protein AK812_SmicGene36609 [Symbiodinium microadriaticum]|uniref:Uncharacterized protein n=1 Tax=Symbiodinium microadriaticum TaxID=2951 RepID=A0A1Q9CIF7_SYMMI|nr:hypothetical protein AK812_SmicGene36609 [Symbiodinium microadriaticum]